MYIYMHLYIYNSNVYKIENGPNQIPILEITRDKHKLHSKI